ncbi:MAG: potassium channel family protein [Acidobacteriota bacterium]
MDNSSWLERKIDRRVQRWGLRPWVAASFIASAWIVAIAAFGTLQHLVDPESIDTVWLGMWWATETVTTVGYGDVIPAQASGKVIASVMMIGGLAMFSVITGIITSAFVTRAQSDRSADSIQGDAGDSLEPRLDQVVAELKQVRLELSRLQGDDPTLPPRSEGRS